MSLDRQVVVRLTYAEMVVLFELLHRWEEDKTIDALPYVDTAEQRAMGNLTAALEPVMDDAFNPEYAAVVQAARDYLRDSIS